VGRIVGKAVYDGQLLDAYFTRAFYAHIPGVRPTYHNNKAQDPDYYMSLRWMLQSDITNVVDETFSTVYEEFGQERTRDLK
jgi:E3 ubiquitin-protein ligase HUWE1